MTQGGLRLAVFDLDDTLVKGSLGMDWVANLRQNGKFAEGAWQSIGETRSLLSDGKIGYLEGFGNFTVHWAKGVAGARWIDLCHSALSFANQSNGRLDGAQRVVTRLKNMRYVTAIITGSPLEIAQAANGRIGANFVRGTEAEERGEIYTGVVKSAPVGYYGKARVLLDLATWLNADLSLSVAFGDSIHDVSMLELVGCAVVIGSNPEMVKLAKKRSWRIYPSISDVLCDSEFWASLGGRE